jgi:hypothetical protein
MTQTKQFDLPRYLLDRVPDPRLLEVPEGRRELTLLDPMLFGLTYFPDLFEVQDEILVTGHDLDLCRTAVTSWTKDPPIVRLDDGEPAFLDTVDRPAWRTVLPIWAAAHGHLDALISTHLVGAELLQVHTAAATNELIRLDYPKMWTKPTRRGWREYQKES